jgi:hypothetical protein
LVCLLTRETDFQSRELEKQLDFVNKEELALNRLHLQFRSIVKERANPIRFNNADHIQEYDFRTAGNQLRDMHEQLCRVQVKNEELSTQLEGVRQERWNALQDVENLNSQIVSQQQSLERANKEIMDSHDVIDAIHATVLGDQTVFFVDEQDTKSSRCLPVSDCLQRLHAHMISNQKHRIDCQELKTQKFVSDIDRLESRLRAANEFIAQSNAQFMQSCEEQQKIIASLEMTMLSLQHSTCVRIESLVLNEQQNHAIRCSLDSEVQDLRIQFAQQAEEKSVLNCEVLTRPSAFLSFYPA